MPRQYMAAAIQFEPTLGETEHNTQCLAALVEQAALAGARVIVTPEMAITGYCWRDRAEVAPFTETVPGPSTDRFLSLAHRHGCFIALGLVERDPETDLYYNTAVLLGPDGILTRYRKSHVFISEPRWAAESFVPPTVVETPYGRLGLIICMDADFVEPARLLGVAGCDIMLLPTCWLDERAPAPAWIARASENGVYFIAADRYGLERGVQFSGGSCILSPDGAILSSLDTGDGVVLAPIDLDKVTNDAHRAGRRPEAYQRLASHTYMWNPHAFHSLYGDAGLPQSDAITVQVAQADTGDVLSLLKQNEVGVTVLPGLSRLAGIPATRNEAATVAEPLDGPTVSSLRVLASQIGGALVGSFVECLGADLYITVVLVKAEGLRAHYRTLHFGGPEERWATPGTEEPPVYDLPTGRVGLLWGGDLLFPESSRLLALRGADVISVSAALTDPVPCDLPAPTAALPIPAWDQPIPCHYHIARMRAYENNTIVAFANRSDAMYMGESGAFGAELNDIETRLPGKTPGVTRLEFPIDPARSRYPTTPVRAKELLQKRVPALYAPLVVPLSDTK